MAEDTFEAAAAASRQAREERMASVGALPMTGLQLLGAPALLEPSEQLETDCQDQVQTLAVEIVNRGAAARATVQGVQRPEGETSVSAGRGTTQPGTMPPPPVPGRTGVSTSTATGPGPTVGTEGATRGTVTGPSFRPPPGVPRPEPRRPPPSAPLRTVRAPASQAGQQLIRGPGGPGLGPATATRPVPATVTRAEPRRPQGLGPPVGPTPVTRASSRVEFNAQMSREDILRALKQLLPNQFKEPLEVAAEFAGAVAQQRMRTARSQGGSWSGFSPTRIWTLGSAWTGRRPCTTSEGCEDGCAGRNTSGSPHIRGPD
jgi:hypothetical protein